MEKSPSVNKTEHEPNVEVERKYLLASAEDASKLEQKIKQIFPDSHFVSGYSETSYYFPKITKDKARQLLTLVVRYRKDEGPDLLAKLEKIPEGMPITVRLRRRKNFNEGKSFILAFKASTNPLHDTERIEIESSDISENYLEGFAANGVEPESIWHSNRRVYGVGENTKIDVQNVTGYGYTAEIESNSIDQVNEVAGKLGIHPLSKVLLDAMYKKYVEHWEEYYNSQDNGRHFSEDDWKEIESTSKESLVKNRIN